MGIYQFYARRYDMETGTFIDAEPKVWGFSVCTYKPFPSYRTSTIQPLRNIEHGALNVMDGVIEVRDVYGKAENGVKFVIQYTHFIEDILEDFFVFYANNSFSGYFNYHGREYDICGGAGSTYYKKAVFESPVVAAGVKTGCLSITSEGNIAAADGKFWLYGGTAFTEESAEAFKNLINIHPYNIDYYMELGVYPFLAKRYDVVNAKFLDENYKMYSFSVINTENWVEPGSQTSNVDIRDLVDSDITDVFASISDNMPSNTNEIRFCVTESHTDNYFYFFRRAPRDGGFVYRTLDHPRIFGSSGTLHHTKRAVLSSMNVSASTKTGTFWHVTSDLLHHYRLSCENTFGVTAAENFKSLIGLSPCFQNDPFDDAGTSESDGGDGDFIKTSDPIVIPNPPTITTASTGLLTMFTPSSYQLKMLADYMWANPLFDVGGWKKLFADPMQAILGLSLLPVNIPTSGDGYVTVGNISTEVMMPMVTQQYVTVDCGGLHLGEYWGAYLDYDPFTKMEIYLPYCGIHPISADDVVGKMVTVKYNVDILSGACCAYVQCAGSILYSYIGQCAATIPVTGDNWTNMINGVMNAAVGMGVFAATGGNAGMPQLASTALNCTSMKPNIQRSGSMSGAGGLLAYQKPYIIITRPRQALPENQNKFTGYPSYITTSLIGLKGYTEIESVRLENIAATKEELDEIEKLLKEGVIL